MPKGSKKIGICALGLLLVTSMALAQTGSSTITGGGITIAPNLNPIQSLPGAGQMQQMIAPGSGIRLTNTAMNADLVGFAIGKRVDTGLYTTAVPYAQDQSMDVLVMTQSGPAIVLGRQQSIFGVTEQSATGGLLAANSRGGGLEFGGVTGVDSMITLNSFNQQAQINSLTALPSMTQNDNITLVMSAPSIPAATPLLGTGAGAGRIFLTGMLNSSYAREQTFATSVPGTGLYKGTQSGGGMFFLTSTLDTVVNPGSLQ